MYESIDDYLEQLKVELDGCDPATIQDALSDAGEHLQTALDRAIEAQSDLTEADALRSIMEKYGTPAEVAAAYRELEARVPPALYQAGQPQERPFVTRFFGVLADPRSYASLLYLFFSLVTGIVYFTWAVTGISLSAGLIVLIIGLPFFGLFLLSVRGISLVEGRIVEALLGIRMPRRQRYPGKHTGNLWEKFKILVTDRRTWTTIAYMILQLPLGIFYFTISVVMIALALWGILRPILELVFDLPMAQFNEVAFYTPVWFMPIAVIVGVLWLILTMHLAKLLGRTHGAIAKSLLVRRD
jgi:hypothetical protein